MEKLSKDKRFFFIIKERRPQILKHSVPWWKSVTCIHNKEQNTVTALACAINNIIANSYYQGQLNYDSYLYNA